MSDDKISEIVALIRTRADGYHGRGNYEIEQGRERAGMRLRTAGLALSQVADEIAADYLEAMSSREAS